jgi:hypothetical protein
MFRWVSDADCPEVSKKYCPFYEASLMNICAVIGQAHAISSHQNV